jgi:hypothetical protein
LGQLAIPSPLKCRIENVKLTVAILLGAPLTSQNLDRVHAAGLAQKFKVIILDVSTWVYPKSADLNIEQVGWERYLKINSIVELREFLEKEKIAYALDFIGKNPIRNHIARELRKRNSRLVVQKFGPLPTRINPRSRILEIKNQFLRSAQYSGNQIHLNSNEDIKSVENTSIIYKIFSRLTNSFVQAFYLRLDNPYILLQVGNRFANWESIFATKVIQIASNDFHHFNSEPLLVSEETLNAKNYAVFVDDCLIEALDWRIIGLDAPINKENYFKALNSFFDRIEIDHDVRVVIAGHPNTEDNSDYNTNFMNRPVIYSNTCVLVQNARFIMIHASTAISYAVLAKKPIIIMTSNDIMKTNIGRAVQAMKYSLGTYLVNLDSPPKKTLVPKINNSKYMKYEQNYIKSSRVSEEEPMENFTKFVTGRW